MEKAWSEELVLVGNSHAPATVVEKRVVFTPDVSIVRSLVAHETGEEEESGVPRRAEVVATVCPPTNTGWISRHISLQVAFKLWVTLALASLVYGGYL